MPFDVMKIGGAVLSENKGFVALLKILSTYCTNPTLFVFSAFSDFSRRLKNIAIGASQEEFFVTQNLLKKLHEDAVSIANSILSNSYWLTKSFERLEVIFDDIEKILFGVAVTHELTPRILDKILSYGEYLSTIILENFFLYHNVKVKFLDSGEFIITDENFGNASPIDGITAEKAKQAILPLFEKFNFIFTQGFIGRSQKGYPTTMGFESSNLTALLLAKIIEANKVIFWTDVEGIRTADPKLVKDTLLIEELSIEDAKFASLNRLKLIHPKMIEYFENSPETEYYYCSAFQPENGKTKIVFRPTNKKLPIIIINSANEFIHSQNLTTNIYFSQEANISTVLFNEEEKLITPGLKTIALVNVNIPVVLSFLSQCTYDYKYAYVDNKNKLVKILLEESDVKEFSNALHKELIHHLETNKECY
ncbi:MAG: amino acid kinase family protein [Candidatus Kapaibacteriales bacterium]